MKKVFVYFCLMLAVAVFASCSAEDEESKSVNAIEAEALLQNGANESGEIAVVKEQIAALNVGVAAEHPHTRGFWNKLKKWISVVFADVKGAAVSVAEHGFKWDTMVASAAVASIDKATEVVTGSSNIDAFPVGYGNEYIVRNPVGGTESNSGSTSFSDKGILSFVDSVGDFHNIVVKKVVLTRENAFEILHCTAEQLADTVATATEIAMRLRPGTLTTDIKTMNSLKNQILTFRSGEFGETVDEMIASMADDCPREAELMGVIKVYLEGLECYEDAADAQPYSEEVLKIIDDSDLSDDSKLTLRSAISIGFASANLWDKSAMEADGE